MLVPYSDTYGMVAPITSLLFFAYVRNRPLRLEGCTFLSVLGYFIKPTSILVLCAILLAEVCSLSGKKADDAERDCCRPCSRAVTSVLAIAFAAFAAMAIDAALISHYDVDKSRSLCPEHYLMLGANRESNGR